MKLPRNLGMLLLAIWLVVTGLGAFISFGSLGILIPLLAIAAGVLLLLGR
jgi:hypothetical protein